MSFPTQNTNHVAEGIARLTSAYRDKPVIVGTLTAYLRRVQAAEDRIWGSIRARLLTRNPTGDALDKLGAIVGEGRRGRGDAAYLAAVLLRVLVNRSSGRCEDVIAAVVQLPGVDFVRFRQGWLEGGVMSFTIEATGVPIGSESAVAEMLDDARQAGVYGVLVTSEVPAASTWFCGDSVAGGGTPVNLSFVGNAEEIQP